MASSLADRLASYNVTRLPSFTPTVSRWLAYAIVEQLRTPASTRLFGDDVWWESVVRGGRVREPARVTA